MADEDVTLQRDCRAVPIPGDEPTTLPAGTWVFITQEVGGEFTIEVPEFGGLYRVSGEDADALGKTPPVATKPVAESGPVDEKAIWDQLRNVFDPELPANIVDLGLIYDLEIGAAEDGGNRVKVKMTLTNPGCPVAGDIASDVKTRVENVPGVTEAYIDVVFDPPWAPEMMSEAARLELGLD